MATVLPNGRNYFATSTGAPLVGGKVYTYVPGTSTPKDTYTTSAASVANTNPVVLDSRGEAAIYWSGEYDVILKDASDVTIWGPERVQGQEKYDVVGDDIASASTIVPPRAGSSFHITGTSAITAISSANSWNGRTITLIFDGALTFTHSSNLALPGSLNITTAANDVAVMRQNATSVWRCISYVRSATPLPYGDSYTPTATGTANITSITPRACYFIRAGNTVFVGGQLTIDPVNTATLTQFRITLPIASNFTTSFDAAGIARIQAEGVGDTVAYISSDTVNDALGFTYTSGSSAAAFDWVFQATYKVA